MCKNNQQAKQNGFTLIEIIISMLIFAVISLISYNALQIYSTNQKLSFEHLQKINDLQKTILFIKRDISQLFNQDIVLQDNVLTLNSLQNDSVLNIRYQLEDENLVRKEDGDDKDNTVSLILIKNINKIKWRLLNSKNKWLIKYNKKNNKNQHIEALELDFTSDYWGKIKQLVIISE